MPSVEDFAKDYVRLRQAVEVLEGAKTMAGDRKEPGTEITLMTGERLFIPDSLRKLYSNYGYEYEDDRAKEAVLIPWHNIKRITTYLG